MTDRPGGIPRYRETALPALFSQGFRPFFLAASVWAPLSLGLWMLELSGVCELPTAFDPSAWHAHEMLFGFASAAMAGFLMTAIPNWTGRMPLQGMPLLILVASWLAGRIAVSTSALIGAVPAALADLSFPALLVLAIGREVIAGRNWRNLPMIVALTLLLATNATTHLDAAGLVEVGQAGSRAAIAIFALLIAMVGGRIIPSFTRNRLAKLGADGRPAGFSAVDRTMLVSVAAALGAWVAAFPALLAGPLLLLAAAVALIRLMRWRGWLVGFDPSLLVLHLGYAWLCVGLTLLGTSELWPALPAMAGLHALTVGAIATTILGVMSRTTLSHTGRRSFPKVPAAGAVYVLITISAMLRVFAALVSDFTEPLLWSSALAWILAFVLFTISMAGTLVGERMSARRSQ